MLKGVDKIVSPLLLKALCEMGHGDKLVIADANFPSHSVGRNAVIVHMDGNSAQEVLSAVLKLIPLDTYVDQAVHLMEKVPGDNVDTPIWKEYERIVAAEDERGAAAIGFYERFEFYRKASEAYLIIVTGEKALYANVMVQKGVI